MGISREAKAAYDRKRYAEKRDAILAQQQQYLDRPGGRERARQKTAQWRSEHPEHKDRWNDRYGKDYIKAWRKANPEKARRHWKNESLKKIFGITIEQFDEMLEAQNHLCAICGQPETRTWKGRTNLLSVDHDHESGRVRALLCGACNHMIGDAKDDPQRLAAAIDYLAKYV